MMVTAAAVTTELSLKVLKQLPGDLWRKIVSQAQNGENLELDNS